MHVYKYGIVVHQLPRNDSSEWRVALLDGPVSDHGYIDVPLEVFNFQPAPGISVKAKFDDEDSDLPAIVTKCGEFEWIRDVEVVNSKVVIFIVIHLSAECFERVVHRADADLLYYIIQNDNTDLRKIAIPKDSLDNELRNRSPFQREDQPLIYRVGVCWDPLLFEGGMKTNWRYYHDFPMVPIFELYYRETTLPYLSESMIYGVLEGIVIAENENGALFWTPQMGCAVLSSFTRDTDMPPLGSVNFVLAKRCLPENSFGFPCFYELLPETRKHNWEPLKIVTDEKNGCVYMEVYCECVPMSEKDISSVCMIVPHIGKVYRGLQRYIPKLYTHKKYYFRIEFQKEYDSYVPVIVDLCLDEDADINCRVVHISQETKAYFAVLEPSGETFEGHKQNIDFVVIPFRVLFCAKSVYVENEELLVNVYRVRIRLPKDPHDIVDAVHVESISQSQKDSAFSIINGTVWLRTMVMIQNLCEGPIDLLCTRLEQKITDFSRLAADMPNNSQFAVHAQFALTPGNEPVFWVRSVAPTTRELPRMTMQSVARLPTLQEVFDSVYLPGTLSHVEEARASTHIPLHPNVTQSQDTDSCNSDTRPEDLTLTEFYNEDAPTILNESEYERRFGTSFDNRSIQGSVQFSENIVVTESCFASSSAASTATIVPYANSRVSGVSNPNLVNESPIAAVAAPASFVYDSPSKTAAIDVSKVSIHDPEQLPPQQRESSDYHRTKTSGTMRVNPFGPSSYHNSEYPAGRGRSRLKPVKYGFRQQRDMYSHGEILHNMVYYHMQNRMMFVDNTLDAQRSWFRPPNSSVTSTKKNLASVIGIEMVEFQRAARINSCRFESLVRFVVVKDGIMNVVDTSVVVPVGGRFPNLPKSFQLGERYKVEHFSFKGDKMCRFGGFATALNQFKFDPEPPFENIKNISTEENRRGQQYLRFETKVCRPCKPEIESNVFELWSSEHVPGFIVVEKKPDLMKFLELPDPETYEQDDYSAFIEPLAGGPIDLSILNSQSDTNAEVSELFVFWRLVVEFSDSVPIPELIHRREKMKPSPVLRKREVGGIFVKDYGCWKTARINSVLAQKKLDHLRSLNDPRVRMLDGPDLKPEIEVRKVDVDSRRKCMFNAMTTLLEQLPKLNRTGMFCHLTEDSFQAEIDKLDAWNDDYHPHQFKKRNYSLEIGLNYLANMLVNGRAYKTMNEDKDFAPLLKVLAECIDLNTTYLKKTEDVQKMLLYFRKNKLNNYF